MGNKLRMNSNELLKRFKEAMLTEDVYLCYQPQFNHVTGRMVGAEALMRWHDKEYGDQYPSDFIPVLEELGYMHDADLHVFELICIFLRKCLDENVSLVPISFNISRYDIYNHDYVSEIENIRKQYDIPVGLLRAEITESSAIGGIDLVINTLRDLHKAGYIVEKDDFGHGYSSLNILKDLPVDIIKLDMRFLSGNVESRGGVILNSVVQLSKWLNTPLIAEGVETNTQADFMKSLGCNYMQGYLYSKPLKEEDFLELLKKSSIDAIANTDISARLVDIYKFFDPNSMETEFFNTYVHANDKYFEELTILNHNINSIVDIYAKQNSELFKKAILETKETQKEAICDTWIHVLNNTCGENSVCVRNYITILAEIDNKYVLYLTVRNVTEEKLLMDELMKSESKFRYASEHTDTYSWEYDIDTKCMYPCSRCKRDLNMPDVVENYPEPVIGSLFPIEYGELYRNWHKRLAEGEKHLEAIIPLTSDKIPFRVEYTNIFDEGGRPYKAYGSATRIEDVDSVNTITAEMAHIMAGLHVAVYEVDLKTDDFIVFYSSIENKKFLGDIKKGKDFFKLFNKKVEENLLEEDKERVLKESEKEFIINSLNTNGIYRHVYKFNKKNNIRYAQVKILYMDVNRERLAIILDDITSAVEDKNAYIEAKSDNTMYSHIMNALSKDYINLYYVNLETDTFTEYMQGAGNVNIVRKGFHFFTESLRDAIGKIHPDDIEMFIHEFDKSKILKVLEKGQTYTITYRLLKKDSYIYAGMKISSMDGHHAIIGVSDITRQSIYSDTLKRMEEEKEIYSRIFALAGNFLCIYIVEEDGSYIKYSSDENRFDMEIPKRGKNFFETSLVNTKKIAVIEDWPYIVKHLDERFIRSEIKKKGFSEAEYRLIINKKPTYVNLKSVFVTDSEGTHLVMGLNDVDNFVRSKQKYDMELLEANTRANIDSLTGVRNKYAYLDMESTLNRQIIDSKHFDFGIALFDVNNLKSINDEKGQKAGDDYLKYACSVICNIFNHSPVFRVGGDEFVAILRGSDYEHAQELYDALQEHNEKSKGTDKAIISCGIARYAGDSYVSDVYSRAEKQMYINKQTFKNS